jgi:hypothetical protein
MEFLDMPCADAPLFDTAIQFWEAVVTSDIPDHIIPLNFLQDAGFCGPGFDPPEPADDLYICGLYTTIDGGSGVLGTGTSVNDGSGIPKPILWGILKLDTGDQERLQNDQDLYYDVILHEIGTYDKSLLYTCLYIFHGLQLTTYPFSFNFISF